MPAFVVALALTLVVAACRIDDDAGSTPLPSVDATGEVLGGTEAEPTTSVTNGEPSGGSTTEVGPPVASFEDAPGPLFGVTVVEGAARRVEAIEQVMGTQVHLVRVYARWDTDLGATDVRELIDGGRRVHLSVRPVTGAGQVVPWLEIATAREGNPRMAELTAWVDEIVALGPGTYVTFNHEPEAQESAANGDAAAFRAAWRRFVMLLRERGGEEIRTVWTMTQGAFSDGRAEQWYPGDDVVDVIGVDTYNWFACQGTDREWQSFSSLLTRPLEFADARGKRLAVPEFATSVDASDPGRRAAWIDEVGDVLLDAERVDRIEFVAWFNAVAPDGNWPNCNWLYDADPASATAFRGLVRQMVGLD